MGGKEGTVADSRQRIIGLLKRHGPLSAGDLSRALSLTTVTVRHHMEGLIAGGLVSRPLPRPRVGPGRPERVYALTAEAEKSLPENYAELCRCLVHALVEAIPPERLGEILRDAGSRLGEQEGLGARARPSRRIHHALAFLDSRGYFPEWEAGTARLTLCHCPYQDLAQAAPALCQFDRALLEGLLSAKVTIVSRILDDEPVCIMAVQSAGFDIGKRA
jgi:predicted ArsR family transcriptional regulator